MCGVGLPSFLCYGLRGRPRLSAFPIRQVKRNDDEIIGFGRLFTGRFAIRSLYAVWTPDLDFEG